MKQYLVALFCVLFTPLIYSATVIQGNDTTNVPKGFKTPVTAKVIDPQTGTLYVGITNSTAPNQSGAYSVSKISRPNATTVPVFSGIAKDTTDTTLTNQTIEYLTLIPQTNTALLLGIVTHNGSFKEQTIVAVLPTNGNDPQETSNLQDATGAATTAGIVGIAARVDHIVAAVRPNGGDFGDADSGLALIGLDRNTANVFTDVQIKDATTGLDGNMAIELQGDTAVFDGGGAAVTFSSTTTDANMIAIHYDEIFDRFYIGVRINSTVIGKAVATARVDIAAGGELLLEQIVANGAISGADEIITATAADLSIKHIRTMHTSTGPSYLIINGGQDVTDSIGNLLFALPLVNDETSPTNHGTLAKKDSALVGNVFTTAATAGGDLALATDSAAMIGAGPIPIAADDDISDIVVVGDAVFISINKEPSATNDTGIWHSQALFDNTGKIIRWTPWTKRVTPLDAFPGTLLPNGMSHSGAVKFFDIDAKTGNLYIVEGDTGQVVGITGWSSGVANNGLIKTLASAFSQGTYSALDLDQATRGFSGNTEHRYALFGGVNKVIFSRTSQQPTGEVRQTVITDFSSSDNLLATTCPGCVNALEYRRGLTGTADNYFFAGSEDGLFVFASPAGAGFDVSTLSTLSAAPFSTYSWQHISAINGSVIALKASGNGNLYVLTTELTGDAQTPFTSKLYSIPFATTIATMFATPLTIIAQTGVGAFADVSQFFDIELVATGDPAGTPEDTEQLILATNQGLFHSDATQPTGIAGATNQATAAWTLFAGTGTTAFWGTRGINTPIAHTVWPFSAQDQNDIGSFDRGSVHQINGHSADGTTPLFSTFLPTNFNAKSTASAFETLEPINTFWSDGGRRLFVANRTIDPTTQNKLTVVPFDVEKWNCLSQGILNDPTTTIPERFYWIEQIGATGLLLAGGGKGVIGIE